MGQWRPLLQGPDKQRALDVLAYASSALDSAAPDSASMEDVCLSSGSGALALYLAYASMITPNDTWRKRTNDIINQSATQLATSEYPCSFLYGLTGIGWVQSHLRAHFGLSSEVDLRSATTGRLSEALSEPSRRPVYEMSQGLVGFGVYAAECVDGVNGADGPEERRLLEQIVSALAATALPSTHGGVSWWTAPQNLGESQRKQAPFGHFNLGLAHGIPSVIAMLGRAYQARCAEDVSRTLFNKAVTWLRAQRQPDDAGSCFGTIVPLGAKRRPETSRVGWCFGDLGLSAAVYSAARSFGDEAVAEEMLEVARRAARREPETCQVKEAGVCHGSAGNAHIFNRLYQATGDQAFHDASRYWMTRTFDYFDSHRAREPVPQPDDKDGKDRANTDDPGDNSSAPPVWSDSPGLFGLTGIALILLAAVTDVEPLWDRALLISMPTSLVAQREIAGEQPGAERVLARTRPGEAPEEP